MTEFEFQKPTDGGELSLQARLLYEVGALASRAVRVERTLCNHPDGRAENDAEHSYSLGLVATPLAGQFYPELDSGLVAKYALVHEITEYYVGDTPTYDISDAGLLEKAERETAGKRQFRQEYASVAPYLVELLEDYEAQKDGESRFVRMVDKIMTVLIQFPNDCATMQESFSRA